MPCSRVEQCRRRGKIVERCDEAIKLDSFVRRAGEAAGNAQEEVLRGFDNLARERVAEEIAVIDRAEAEVFEEVRVSIVDGVIELARVGLDELRCGAAYDALLVPVGN